MVIYILFCLVSMLIITSSILKDTPPNLINIQGHELEGAFIVHTLAYLEIHGQITHLKYLPTYSLVQFLKESIALENQS